MPEIDNAVTCRSFRNLARAAREQGWIDEVIRNVAELPDRDSPEGWPEAMLVTGSELKAIIMAKLTANYAVVDIAAREYVTARRLWEKVWDEKSPSGPISAKMRLLTVRCQLAHEKLLAAVEAAK